MHKLVVLTALLAVGLVDACAIDEGRLPVRQSLTVGGQPVLCVGGGLSPMAVSIDPTASPPVWVTTSGHRYEVIWPPGFSLQVTPVPALRDTEGRAVARDGDRLTNWSGSLSGNVITVCSVDGTGPSTS
jgi:hypothetical protein